MTAQAQPVQQIPVGWLGDGSFVSMGADFNGGAIKPEMDLELLREAVSRISGENRTNPSFKREVDFGRVIGVSQCVPLAPGDRVIYARQRGPSRGRFPLVRDRKPVPTSKVTLTLVQHHRPERWFELVAGYIGAMAPPLPWMRGGDTEEAREFWETHALVYNRQFIVPGTETSRRPW